MSQKQSLKAGNALRYACILLGNVAVFGVLTSAAGDKAASMSKIWPQLQKVLPLGALSLLAGLLINQLSPTMKARIVFLRLSHPLPGYRAFSDYIDEDPRVDRAALQRAVGALPVEPQEQNRTWYKMYRAISTEVSVVEAHRRYLFYRDYATISLFVAVAAIPIARQLGAALPGLLGVFGAAVLQLVLTVRAAQTSGESLVCNVLASYSTQASLEND